MIRDQKIVIEVSLFSSKLTITGDLLFNKDKKLALENCYLSDNDILILPMIVIHHGDISLVKRLKSEALLKEYENRLEKKSKNLSQKEPVKEKQTDTLNKENSQSNKVDARKESKSSLENKKSVYSEDKKLSDEQNASGKTSQDLTDVEKNISKLTIDKSVKRGELKDKSNVFGHTKTKSLWDQETTDDDQVQNIMNDEDKADEISNKEPELYCPPSLDRPKNIQKDAKVKIADSECKSTKSKVSGDSLQSKAVEKSPKIQVENVVTKNEIKTSVDDKTKMDTIKGDTETVIEKALPLQKETESTGGNKESSSMEDNTVKIDVSVSNNKSTDKKENIPTGWTNCDSEFTYNIKSESKPPVHVRTGNKSPTSSEHIAKSAPKPRSNVIPFVLVQNKETDMKKQDAGFDQKKRYDDRNKTQNQAPDSKNRTLNRSKRDNFDSKRNHDNPNYFKKNREYSTDTKHDVNFRNNSKNREEVYSQEYKERKNFQGNYGNRPRGSSPTYDKQSYNKNNFKNGRYDSNNNTRVYVKSTDNKDTADRKQRPKVQILQSFHKESVKDSIKDVSDKFKGNWDKRKTFKGNSGTADDVRKSFKTKKDKYFNDKQKRIN